MVVPLAETLVNPLNLTLVGGVVVRSVLPHQVHGLYLLEGDGVFRGEEGHHLVEEFHLSKTYLALSDERLT